MGTHFVVLKELAQGYIQWLSIILGKKIKANHEIVLQI
jgi:hypothetical protein